LISLVSNKIIQLIVTKRLSGDRLYLGVGNRLYQGVGDRHYQSSETGAINTLNPHPSQSHPLST